MYVSTYKQSKDSENFWNEKQNLLATLSLLVRRYSISLTTSVASESALCSQLHLAETACIVFTNNALIFNAAQRMRFLSLKYSRQLH